MSPLKTLFFLTLLISTIYAFEFDEYFTIRKSTTSVSFDMQATGAPTSMSAKFTNMSGLARINNLELVSNSFPREVKGLSFLPYDVMNVYNVFQLDLSKSFLKSIEDIPMVEIAISINGKRVIDTDPSSYRCVVFKDSQTVVPVKALTQQGNDFSFTVLNLVRDYIGKNNTLMFGIVGKTDSNFRAEFNTDYIADFPKSLNFRQKFAPSDENLKIIFKDYLPNLVNVKDRTGEYSNIVLDYDDYVPLYLFQLSNNISNAYAEIIFSFNSNFTFYNSTNGKPFNIKENAIYVATNYEGYWAENTNLVCNEETCEVRNYIVPNRLYSICGIVETAPPKPNHVREDTSTGITLSNNTKLYLEPISDQSSHLYQISLPANQQVVFTIPRIFGKDSSTFTIYQSYNSSTPNKQNYENVAELSKSMKSFTIFNNETSERTVYFQLFANQQTVNYIDVSALTTLISYPSYPTASQSTSRNNSRNDGNDGDNIISESSKRTWIYVSIGVVLGGLFLAAVITVVFVVVSKWRMKRQERMMNPSVVDSGSSSSTSKYYEMRDGY